MDLISQALQMQAQNNQNLTNTFLKFQESDRNQQTLDRQQQQLGLQLAKEAHNQQQDSVRNQQQNARLETLIAGGQRQNFAPLNDAMASAVTNYNRQLQSQWDKLDKYSAEQTDLISHIRGLAPAFAVRHDSMDAYLRNAAAMLPKYMGQSTPQAATSAWQPASQVGKAPIDQAVAQDFMNQMFLARQKAGSAWTPQTEAAEWDRLRTGYLNKFKDSDELGMKENRLREIAAQQEALQWQLEHPGQAYTDPKTGKKSPSRIQSQEEYIRQTMGPIMEMFNATNAQVMPSQRSTSNGYPITDQAVIATLGDGSPIKINPQSFGGTVKTEDGRTIIVPARGASLVDIGRIERANSEAKKIFDEPLLEDVMPGKVQAQPALPVKDGKGISNLNTQTQTQQTQQDQQATADATKQYQDQFGNVGSSLQQMLSNFRANPQGQNIGYPDFLKLLATYSNQLYDLNRNVAGSPEQVYANLVTKLQQAQFGNKPLLGTLSGDKSQVSSLDNLYKAWGTFENTQGGARNESPWAMGHWVVPSADAHGWQALLSTVRKNMGEEQLRQQQGK